MNLREEDRQKNNCPNRGLGLAAAAIGVGVGAALYYFFSKRPENPATEGSTSHGWNCESPQLLLNVSEENHDSYITISENSTTDTSIVENNSLIFNSTPENNHSEEFEVSDIDFNTDTDSTSGEDSMISSINGDNSYSSFTSTEDSSLLNNMNSTMLSDNNEEPFILPRIRINNNPNIWSLNPVPRYRAISPNVSDSNVSFVSSSQENRRAETGRPSQAFRDRAWTLEECSICFELILRNQEVMSLPCSHNFHQACILPWLQEQQTCPNCRKKI